MSTTLGPRLAVVGRLGEADRGSANALVLAEDREEDDDEAISLCFCSAVTSAATDCANDAMTATNAAVVALSLLLGTNAGDAATCCPFGAITVCKVAVLLPVESSANEVGSDGAGETAVRVAGACSALSSPINAVAARVSEEEEDDDGDDSGCD